MKAHERKAELIRAGKTVGGIAKQIGVTSQHVSMVLHGKRRSPETERAIAKAIGRSVKSVFGKAA